MNAWKDDDIEIPLTEGILVERRDDGSCVTNVPHRVVQHSPDGYNFGYGGSGPADLALNCVEAILAHLDYYGERQDCYASTECFSAAWVLHQPFKWKFIAALDQETGGTIPWDVAVEWVKGMLRTMEKPEALFVDGRDGYNGKEQGHG